jgi:predicted negative regulator of RcsB-dependent stress response
MAKHLDLEEQEQLDQLKAFWNQYGNLVSSALIVVFGGIAAYNGYQYWQRNQASQASVMYDEVERAVKSDDAAKVERAFTDMKDKFGNTIYAQQAGLLAASQLQDKGNTDAAKAALTWVAENASDEGYKSVAKLRLAAVLMESKSYDLAAKQLEGTMPAEFAALVADRRGDIFLAQGKKDDAKAAYQTAYAAFEERSEYRRLVEVKLTSLGVDVSTLNPAAKMAADKPMAESTTAPEAASAAASADTTAVGSAPAPVTPSAADAASAAGGSK